MKKFTILAFCFIMILSCCLTGCSTFSIDYVKFYNETVAVVNNEKIIRYDLLNSYNSYGTQFYINQMGKSEEDALKDTLDTMIDRKLLAGYAKNDPKYALTEFDINSVYQAVLDSLQESYDGFLTTAREMYGFDEPAEEETAEEETAYLKENYKYKKRAKLVTGDIIKYELDEDAEKIETYALGEKNIDFVINYSSKTKNDIITKLYATFMKNAYNNKHSEDNYSLIAEKAISLFAKNLISYEYYLRDENGKAYNTKTADLIKRYIERMYDSEIESAYIANVEEYYLKEQSELQKLTVDKLINKYISLTETDFAKYVNSTTDYYNYLKTIGSNAEMVYYTPENADADFGYFLHVLLPLDEAVVENINQAKSKVEQELYDDNKLQDMIDEIISNQTHQERSLSDGLLIEGDKGIFTILEEYKNVNTLDEFMDFMFKYTSDTATLTADMPYVIGYDDLGDEDESNDVNYSNMVTEFTNEAIRLLKSENEYMTSSADYIITQYGIHLLYEVGKVKADFKYSDRNKVCISLDQDKDYNLYFEKTNELTGKTYFDLLFDLVYPASEGEIYATENGYTEMEKSILSGLKTPKTVTLYTTKINSSLDLIK